MQLLENTRQIGAEPTISHSLGELSRFATGESVSDPRLVARRQIYGSSISEIYAARLVNAVHSWSADGLNLRDSQRGRHLAYAAHLYSLGLIDMQGELAPGMLESTSISPADRGGILCSIGETEILLPAGAVAEESRTYCHGDQEFACWTRQPSLNWLLNDRAANFYVKLHEYEPERVQQELLGTFDNGFDDPSEEIEELLFETSPPHGIDPLLLMVEKGITRSDPDY